MLYFYLNWHEVDIVYKNAPLYNFFAAHLPGFRFPEYRNLQHAFRGTGKIDNPLVDEWPEGPDGELGTYMQANYSFNTPEISPGLSTISSAPAFSSSSLVPYP